jgi:DNA-binding CsgD family transcriptional regulator
MRRELGRKVGFFDLRAERVLLYAAAGMSRKQIAMALRRSLNTVREHVRHLLHKIDAPSIAVAVARVNAEAAGGSSVSHPKGLFGSGEC